MTDEKAAKTSDASRTGSKADKEREKLVKTADEHRKQTEGGDEVVPDPANDWPAS